MAGLGDLVLTPYRQTTRNRRFGMMLGRGMDVKGAQDKIGRVVEGYRNTKEVRELAHRFGKQPQPRKFIKYCIAGKTRARQH